MINDIAHFHSDIGNNANKPSSSNNNKKKTLSNTTIILKIYKKKDFIVTVRINAYKELVSISVYWQQKNSIDMKKARHMESNPQHMVEQMNRK